MKPILIIPIESYPKLNITNYRFILKVEDIIHIQKALDIAKEHDQCISILCDFSDVNVVPILNMNIQSSVNMYINCTFNGDILSVLKSMKPMEKHEQSPFITFLFPTVTPNLVTLLKVLSSCGYKSGLIIDNKNINQDEFIELASYSYLSPVPHAQIEPFGFIQQEIHDKSRNIDINKYYFNSPDIFVHVVPDRGLYIKSEFSELNKHLCNKIEELSQIDFSDISMEYKKLRFYNHFDTEDRCSKCANFKICSGVFHNRFENCQETMSTIYEMLF